VVFFIQGKANDIMQIRIFLDLHHRLFITQAQFIFDDQLANIQPYVFAWAPLDCIHQTITPIAQTIPRSCYAQFNPIVSRI